jgi:hypothetical protein
LNLRYTVLFPNRCAGKVNRLFGGGPPASEWHARCDTRGGGAAILAAASDNPYLKRAMHYDPRDPDLLKWLAVLPLERQYVYRCALLSIFESFRTNPDFKTDTETIRLQLAPNEKKLARLWRQANEKVEEIRRYLETA